MHTSTKVLFLLVIGGVVLAMVAEPARGQQCEANELAKLTASDRAPGDEFGYDGVSISGDTAVIGAPCDDDGGTDSGSAYVYRYDGSAWVEEAKLTASDGAPGDRFGRSVSISGDTAVIGAYLDDDKGSDSGSAYVFVNSNGIWVEQAKLTGSSGEAGDRFGKCVSISDDTVVIGAVNDDDKGTKSGSAYVFGHDGSVWIEAAKLTASDGAGGDHFGDSLSITGDTLVIGAWGNDDKGGNSGSAYVFVNSNGIWIEQDKLTASDGAGGDEFGDSVSVSGATAVIGAYRDNSAYVFVNNDGTWVEDAKLTASDSAPGEYFGRSVSISGDTAVIGAYGDDDKGTDSGSAYVYQYDGAAWVEEVKLTASDGAAYNWFGFALSVSGGTTVIGANGNDEEAGAGYVFTGLGDCNANGTLDICDIADGMSLDENTNGMPDECEPTVVQIDIKPGSYPNAINLGSHGVIPVAILTTEEFDATTVDPDTVELAGATVAIRGNGKKVLSAEEDVDGDGDIDLLLHVETENLELETGVTEATLTGQTYDAQEIIGSDTTEIVPE